MEGTDTEDSRSVTVGQAKSGSGGVLLRMILGEGIDHEHGLDITPRYAVPSKVPQLVINRAIPVGFLSPIGAANARLQGKTVTLFGPILANHTSLMVRPDAPYEGWEDLENERVGILPDGTGTYNHAKLRLAADGINIESAFDLRKGSPGSIHSLNGKGEVAAHVHFIPTSIRMRQSEEFREVEFIPDAFEEQYGRNFHFGCLMAYQNWIDDNREVARRLKETFIDANARMSEDPTTYLARYREQAGYENDRQIELAAERTPSIYPTEWTSETRRGVREQISLAKDAGILPPDAPEDVTAGLD